MAAKRKDDSESAPQANKASEVLKLMAQLSDEERQQLTSQGVTVPRVSGAGSDTLTFGYKCRYCGDVALEFVGDEFHDGTGTPRDLPPHNIPLSELPWIQSHRPGKHVDRQNPSCQRCNAGLFLNRGRYCQSEFIVRLAGIQTSSDVIREARKQARRITSNSAAVPVQDSREQDMRLTPESKQILEQYVENSIRKLGPEAFIQENKAPEPDRTPEPAAGLGVISTSNLATN